MKHSQIPAFDSRHPRASGSGFFNPRVLLALALCSTGVFLAMFSLAAHPPGQIIGSTASSPGNAFVANSAGRITGNMGAATSGMPLAPTGPGWPIITSPNNDDLNSYLSEVTCVSASDCWTVGYYYNVNGADQTLIGHWNGTVWSIVASPNTSATQDNLLKGVTCASTSDCWAAGLYVNGNVDQTLIEHWNGAAWSIVASPNTSATRDNQLFGVTCASGSDCWAAGEYSNGSVSQTLVEHWNGTAWSIVASPDTSASQFNSLRGVTCASTSDCWAAGYYYNGSSAYQTLIEHWNGTAWSIVASPNTSATENNEFRGITCASGSDCWAVGYHYNSSVALTLIEHWNGTAWSIVTSPNTSAAYDELYGVTCASGSDCWAIGDNFTANNYQTLIEHWNGTAWSIVVSPNTSATQYNQLYGVTCASGLDCWAVGSYYNSDNGHVYETLIEHWNGTAWSIAVSPNPNPTQNNFLYGVTCVSASDCWAAGYYVNGISVDQTLIEHWNGSAWSIVSSPDTTSNQSNILRGITCNSTSDCWAVGYYGSGGVNQTLTLHWNGTSWSIVTSPNTSATQDNELNSVACTSTTDCWAVGYFVNSSSVDRTLVEHWNGSGWTIITSQNPAGDNKLHGVTCTSASDCWAVGESYNGSVTQTLVEHWNGAAWAIVTSPNNSGSNELYGVTCTSISDCWAVGQYPGGSAIGQTLTEHWNGTAWSIVGSPNTSAGQYNILLGVTCTSGSNCWAVGFYYSGLISQTLIEHWNGTAWSIATSSDTSASQSNNLNAVTCASASDCWTVGYYNNGSVDQTLIERYSDSIPPLATVVSRKVHGTAGIFNIDLPLTGTRGVECRNPGNTGTAGVDYKVVFSFINNVAGCGSTDTPGGVTSAGPGPNECTVDITGVANIQNLTVTLNNVLDSQNNPGNVAVVMGVLIGDTTSNGSVNATDVSQTKLQSGQAVSGSNFRNDVTVSGSINASDVSSVKLKSGTALP